MSILNLGVLNAIKNRLSPNKKTDSQTAITLVPEVEFTTNIFTMDSAKSNILYLNSAITTGVIEATPRYHDVNGNIVGAGAPFNLLTNSYYSRHSIDLDALSVSFRLVNKGTVNKVINSFALSERGEIMPDVILFGTGEHTFVQNIKNTTDIMETTANLINLSVYGPNDGPVAANVGIAVRYHNESGEIHTYDEEVIYTLKERHNNEIKPFNLRFKRFSLRFVNYSINDFPARRMRVSFSNAVASGSTSDTLLPLSPDGAMYVQLKDEVDSAAYDAFYGSLKTLRTYKPDFRLVLMPSTEKKNKTREVHEFNLQYGVEHVRMYLKVTPTGTPFPSSGDGLSLNIYMTDTPFTTKVLETTAIKSGSKTILLGASDLIDDVDMTSHLFGTQVRVEMITTGTVDTDNFYTYEIVTFQKFK